MNDFDIFQCKSSNDDGMLYQIDHEWILKYSLLDYPILYQCQACKKLITRKTFVKRNYKLIEEIKYYD